MQEQFGALLAVCGAAATPLVLAAVRWAPGVGREVATAPRSAVGRWRALGVAVLCAATLAVLGARIGADAALPAFVCFGLVAVVLALIDASHHRLPDVLTLPSYVVGIVLLALAALLGSDSGSLTRALAGAAIGFGAYAVLFLVARSGLGAGDVKLAGVVGLHAAWVGWGALTIALVGGFVIGGIVSLVLLATRRVRLKTALPFGPAMVAAAVLGSAYGEPIAAAWRGG